MTDPGPRLSDFAPEALAAHAQLFHGHLSEITTEGLTAPLGVPLRFGLPHEFRDALADAVVDLGDLIDEIRFSGAMAELFIADYEKRGPLPTETDEEHKRLRALGMPIDALALLRAYFAPLPEPVTLFFEPHRQLAGERFLSLWFAGQLIDSALFRLVAALDRLASMLWAGARLPLADSKGRPRHPAFRSRDLKALASSYPDREMEVLLGLTKHELFGLLMNVRNEFAHSRRVLSELHGHYRIGYRVGPTAEGERIVQALDRQTHLAILLAAYNEILRPAVATTRDCIQTVVSTDQTP